MKNDKLIYAIGSIAIVVAAILKIMHVPYSNSILILVFLAMSVYQAQHVSKLKKRIKELESSKNQ